MNGVRLAVVPPLPIGVHGRRPEETLPFPIGVAGAALFSRGRHALWQGVQALGLEPGDTVLVPALHHGPEIEALVRAGLELSFYEVGRALGPDPEELEALLVPRVRALYLVHYLGFPQDSARWREWCDERSLLLIEDAGRSWLATNGLDPVGSLADLAVFSLRMSVGVPDGGALFVRAAAPQPETSPERGAGAVTRQHVRWAMQRSALAARVGALADRLESSEPDDDHALGDPARAATSATLHLLPRLIGVPIAAKRRANYRLLLEASDGQVAEPFDEVPPGASPFAFPLETDDGERLVAKLAERGIAALDFGSSPHPLLPLDRFPAARDRRARTILLPVHQELRLGDMDRIADALGGPRRRKRAVRVEAIASFDDVAAEWDELAERSGSVFATREWLSLWWRHYGAGKRLLLTSCHDEKGKLFAILPLYLTHGRGLRVVRLLGHGTADQLGPIAAPEDADRAAFTLRQLLDDRTVGWDFFLGELLEGTKGWSSMLGGRTIARDGYPILRFQHATWDEYLQGRSKKFRKELRQIETRLSKGREVRIRLAGDPERLESDLDTLFALHRMRWTDDESPFAANEAFHRELSAIALERGWLHLWFLELDGKPVAAEHTFRFAGAQNHYQGGRHPDWDDASVGTILFIHAVREALEAGLGECRFLRGREPYKYRFATFDPELETVGVARGALGDAALTGMLAARNWYEMGAVRRWLGG